jgi:hypothetical protein
MAKESPSKAEHAAPAKPQQRLLNPEAAVFKPAPMPAPMRLEDLFARFAGEAGQKAKEYTQLTQMQAQMQAQAPPRGNTRGRAQNRRRQAPRSRRPEQVPPEDVAANPDAHGAASHSECGKLPRHTKPLVYLIPPPARLAKRLHNQTLKKVIRILSGRERSLNEILQ